MSQGLSTRPVGTIRVYACGGGGINIGKEYLSFHEGHSADIANFELACIDTSDSNLDDRLIEKTWLFNDLDGSGKIRNSNDKTIAKAVPDILRKFKPADLNIVIFTASGGTGSVAGPLILKQLLEDGHVAVGVVTGSYESIKTAENTIGTMKTLDAISRAVNKPVVIQFGMNRPDVPRSAIDKEAHLMIASLAMLCSRRNHGLDTADIKSFIFFNQSTDVPAQLARIHVYDTIKGFEAKLKDPISVAYLKRDQDDLQPGVFAPYSCDGFMPSIAQSSTSLFFGIENHSFGDIRTELEGLKKEMEMQRKTRQQAVTFAADEDEVSDTGLIL
jgi:hypothetical protein